MEKLREDLEELIDHKRVYKKYNVELNENSGPQQNFGLKT